MDDDKFDFYFITFMMALFTLHLLGAYCFIGHTRKELGIAQRQIVFLGEQMDIINQRLK